KTRRSSSRGKTTRKRTVCPCRIMRPWNIREKAALPAVGEGVYPSVGSEVGREGNDHGNTIPSLAGGEPGRRVGLVDPQSGRSPVLSSRSLAGNGVLSGLSLSDRQFPGWDGVLPRAVPAL